jgi:sugar lactone lactonase YvrE
MVGAVAADDDGGLLVAQQNRLIAMSASGETVLGPWIVPVGVQSRTNDGAVDPSGRFLIGTLSLDGRRGQERLVRLEHDGSLTVIDDDLGLSNGVAWSPDDATFYSVDTLASTIWAREYDPMGLAVGARRALVHIDGGLPDGLAVDEEGMLWVAVWGAGEVRRYDLDGELLGTVRVGAPQVSSVAFAGAALDVLVITTARHGLEPQALAASPDSGRLFTASPGLRGRRSTPWRRSATFD